MNAEITFPVTSILENTEGIVNSCEDLELSSSSPKNDSSTLPVILLTELAALIHLGQYEHARHLWRRYSSEKNNPKLQQFVSLWRALNPLLRAYSQEFINTDNSSDEDVSIGAIPDVYNSLYACAQTGPSSEPLSTYAIQLVISIRGKMVEVIESAFELIENDRCRILLGFSNNKDLNDFLVQRNWSKENGTSSRWITFCQVSRDEQTVSLGGTDRIDYLTNVVGFMETKRFNA